MADLKVGTDPTTRRGWTLPDSIVTQASALLAMRRAGKSNAATVICEELYRAQRPFVVIDPKGDWWGMRSDRSGTKAGLEIAIFGGDHADVPIDPSAGAPLAEFIAEKHLSSIVDCSEFSKRERVHFLTDFANRLYRRNREPLLVVLEEADDYVPQRVTADLAPCVGAWSTLVRRGGFRGLGVLLISQRSAVLNKDVLTQIDNLIVLRTTAPQDRKAIQAWVDEHALGREMLDSLSSLENGEAWIWSPHRLQLMLRLQFRQRQTFDSGATPELGETRPAVVLRDVDLSGLSAQLQEVADRARADDPRALRAEIARLQAQVRKFEEQPADPIRVEVKVPYVPAGVLEGIDRLEEQVARLREEADSLIIIGPAPPPPAPAATPPRPAAARPTRPSGPTAAPNRAAGLGRGESAILAAIAQHQQGVTREQLSVLTGYKRSSRDTYLQKLTAAGLVDRDGPLLVASDAGRLALGADFQPLPTGSALRHHWLERLPAGERNLLAVVLAEYPAGLSREELSDRTGYKRSSRDTYLQKLRVRRLVDTADGVVRASDLLFD